MRHLQLAGFSGPVSSVDPRIINQNASRNQLNVRVEAGDIKPRFGAKELAVAQANFGAILGFRYLQGYSGTTEKEEYVTAQTISGNTRFFSGNASSLLWTEIKNGVSSVNVHASEWVFVAYEDLGFFINPNSTSPVYQHALQDATSLTAVAIPSDPTVSLTYIVKYGGGSTPYTQMSYAGIDVTAEVVYTGAAHSTDSSVESDGSIIIGHGATNVESSFEIDFNGATAGVQDYTYNDKEAFTLFSMDSGFRIDSTSIRVQFSNNDGSPKTLIPDYIKVARTVSGGLERYLVQFGWTDKTRADFDNVRKMKVTYTKVSDSGASRLKMSPMWEGGIDMTQPAAERLPGSAGLFLAYTYYFSTPQFESGLSPVLFVPNSVLSGYSPGAGIDPLGVHLEVTATVSADANVDNIRYYVQDNGTQKFRRLATQADSDLTYDVRLTYTEITRLTEFNPAPFAFANATAACFYKGSLVWLYNTGTDNVRFSRIGEPLKQASTEDVPTDDNRGRTMTLADNAADIPLGGVQAGDSVMIAGKVGVYVTFGDFPAQMTFIRKVSGSFGVAGKYAFCRWKSDNGLPGMAYVSRDGQIYFADPGSPTGDDGDNLMLSEPIREGVLSLRAFFIDSQPEFAFTDFSTVQVVSDDQQESLVIAMGRKKLTLRRRDINGVRSWEPAEMETGDDTVSLRYLDGSTKRRVRGIRSNGYADEHEFDSTNSVFIEGADYDAVAGRYVSKTARDFGNPISNLFYQTKVFVGRSERASIVRAYREDLTKPVTITDYTSFTPEGSSVTVTATAGRLPKTAKGTEHSFRFDIAEDSGPVNRLDIEMDAVPMQRAS